MRTAPHPALVLVVDDDKDLRELYATYLLLGGYGVLEAANGLEAVELARIHSPQLIVSDIEMPRMDGLKLIETLARHPATREIPVLCLTGMDTASGQAARLGCSALMLKPVVPEALVAVATRLLQRGHEPASPLDTRPPDATKWPGQPA
jgi:two-component system chemotaxis response regulator CheY